jgi:hypothetical protein
LLQATVHVDQEADDFDALRAWLSHMHNKRVTQRAHVTFIQFQPEKCPTTNRIHFQVYVQFSCAVNYDKAKALFVFNDKQYHVDACRGSSDQNLTYTSKEETRLEGHTTFRAGTVRSIAGKSGQGSRTDLASFKADIDAGKNWEFLLDNHFETIANCHTFCKTYFEYVQENNMLDTLKSQMLGTTLRGWQQGLVNLIQQPPSDRKIHWLWENVGNVGKSWMARYLQVVHQAIVIQSMKKSDMVYLISKRIRTSNVVIFDLCRTSEDGAVKVVYEVMEMLKNGYLCSGKYDSTSFSFAVPHVIAFANFEPHRDALSEDRWSILHLDGINLVYEPILN